MSQKECMCCGKAFKRKNRSKASKEWSPNSGKFCSLRCHSKYSTWRADRAARCRCGVATGKEGARCVSCQRVVDQWTATIAKEAGRLSRQPDKWTRRIASASIALRIRAKLVRTQRAKRQRPSKFNSVFFVYERKRFLHAEQEKGGWRQKLLNTARNLRGRAQRN